MIKRIAITALWRDSSSYLSDSLLQLEQQEEQLSRKYSFVYSFYENDSVDNTPELLRNWIDRHYGVLLTENRNDPRWTSIPSIRRTKLMAEYRNLALKGLNHINFDYLFVLDTDINLGDDLLIKMIRILDSNPDIGMITPNTIQNVPDAYQSNYSYSYYDSWALIDIQGNQGLSYSSNPFLLSEDRDLWSSGLRVNVQSAFGGAALIRGNIFTKGDILWSGEHGCEHWCFCRKIRNLGYLVTVDPLLISEVNSTKKRNADFFLVQYDKSRLYKFQQNISSSLYRKAIYNIRYVFFYYLLSLKNILKLIIKFFK